jgi:hypothetical protein
MLEDQRPKTKTKDQDQNQDQDQDQDQLTKCSLYIRTLPYPTGGTLIVCPMSLLGQWREELKSKSKPGSLSVHVFYGGDRARDFHNHDVVLTTYGVVGSEFHNDTNPCGLHRVRWERIVLDEAHIIKNPRAETSKSCLALHGIRKWVLTGTPIHNSLNDMFSLLRFLKFEPWCEPIWWKRAIQVPCDGGDEDAFKRLRAVLRPIMLRRTKDSLDAQGSKIVALPHKRVEIVTIRLNEASLNFYNALKERSKVEFRGFVARGKAMQNYAAILTLLLRLRQACNHPFLVLGRERDLAPAQQPPSHTCKSGVEATRALEGGSGGGGGLQTLELSDLYRKFQVDVKQWTHKNHHSRGSRTSTRARNQDGPSQETDNMGNSDINVPNPKEGEGEEGGQRHRRSQAEQDEEHHVVSHTKFVLKQLQDLEADGLSNQECPLCLDVPEDAVMTPCAHFLCYECLLQSTRFSQERSCPVCRTAFEGQSLSPPQPAPLGLLFWREGGGGGRGGGIMVSLSLFPCKQP